MEFVLKLVVEGDREPQEFALEGQRITIGRDPGNQISISETYISSRHAIITRTEDNELFVKDCDSANGTFLNNIRVQGDQTPLKVKVGDLIKFSRLEFEVVAKESVNGIAVIPLSERKKGNGHITTP